MRTSGRSGRGRCVRADTGDDALRHRERVPCNKSSPAIPAPVGELLVAQVEPRQVPVAPSPAEDEGRPPLMSLMSSSELSITAAELPHRPHRTRNCEAVAVEDRPNRRLPFEHLAIDPGVVLPGGEGPASHRLAEQLTNHVELPQTHE